MAWLTDWTYRKSIIIAHTDDGAQTNYQMKLLVGESSGATGEQVDCGGFVASDFDDLRFTTVDGTTLCDYWIESITGATPNQLATVWIEVPAIAAHPDNTTIYMYYGGTTTAVSSGANTFGANKWDNFEWGANGTHIHDHTGNTDWTDQDSSPTISTTVSYTGISTDTRSFLSTGISAYQSAYFAITDTLGLQAYAIQVRMYKDAAFVEQVLVMGDGTHMCWIGIATNGTINYLAPNGTPTDTTYDAALDEWFLLEIRNINYTSATFDIYLNGSLIKAGATMFDNGSVDGTIRLQGNSTTAHCYFDNFIVRKWTTNEPTWSSYGTEEVAEVLKLSGTSVCAFSIVADTISTSVIRKLSGTSVSAITSSGALDNVYIIAGTSAAYVEAVAGYLDNIYSLSGTSVNSISTVGALTLGAVEKLSGTSVCTISTIGELTLGIFTKLSGTSTNVISTIGELTLGIEESLSGTSVNVITTTGELILGITEKLSGTSENVINTIGALTLGGADSLSGTSINVVSTIGIINNTLLLSGTSVSSLTTNGVLNETLSLIGTSTSTITSNADTLDTYIAVKLSGTSVNTVSVDSILTAGVTIDVGSAAIVRAAGKGGNRTWVDLANPADFTGKITNVAIFVNSTMASAKVATFYAIDATHYTARSSGNLGTVPYGLQNKAVNLDVVAGDFIGIYFTDNLDYISASSSGGSGVVYLAGDQTACSNAEFALYANWAISLYGTGATVAVGGLDIPYLC
ncbi:MAG: DUF2341 domain-containing protein [Bacteroidetes bacterium]|nr:DUF2341 domain-containing protein [Bacteroidota bacterium]